MGYWYTGLRNHGDTVVNKQRFAKENAQMKKTLALTMTGLMMVALAGCGASSSEAKTYTVSYNSNFNAAEMPDYQFMKANNAFIMYDARIYDDITLELSGDTYTLTAESYTSDGENRFEKGDGNDIAMSVKTVASGSYTDNGDGTVTIDTPTAVDYSIMSESLSNMMTAAMSFNEDGSDGEWTLEDTPALADMVPSTVFTLDDESGAIVSYCRAEGETGTVTAPAGAAAATGETAEG